MSELVIAQSLTAGLLTPDYCQSTQIWQLKERSAGMCQDMEAKAVHGMERKEDPALETRVFWSRPNISSDGDNAYILLAAVKSCALLSTLQKPQGPGGRGEDTPLLS